MHEPPPSLAVTGLFILLSFFLVFLNGFFVAAEFAIVKVRRTRLEELSGQGNVAAGRSIRLVDQLDEYLSATQLGITLVSLALGWMGEEAFFNLARILFPELVDTNAAAHAVAIGASFFLITFLHVVLGELVPKSMAIQQADIMIPAEKVQYLSLNRSLDDNIKTTERRMYTRFPLAEKDFSQVIGVVHMKDAWPELAEDESNEVFRRVARKPVFIDPKLKQDRIMKIFKDARTHLAVVQDPATKKNVGIVTMEDVLEGIVGEILDEHGN
jgi:CBS domain containing-hemolysin-like protein